MSKPKICLIYTGGTIGMVDKGKGDGLEPPENPDDFLKMAPDLEDIVDFDFVNLLNKDSTNMNPNDWVKMANAVYDRRDMGYKGFVIAHGTDTMHFSSSALAFAFGKNLNFPIVFTGAQTPPNVNHGDARINLLRACKVAIENIAEVVISFGDFVFRGCRVQKKDERRFDAFESPAFYPIGYISDIISITPFTKYQKTSYDSSINYRPYFSKGIVQITLIPGLEYKLILPIIKSNYCEGIILQSFGAGNLPYFDNEYSFIPIIETAKDKNIPTIITSQFPGHSTSATNYKAGLLAHEAGAIPTGNMTSAAATVKFRWVLADILQNIKIGKINSSEKIYSVKKAMENIYVGEMD
jgi:L-asparaginase